MPILKRKAADPASLEGKLTELVGQIERGEAELAEARAALRALADREAARYLDEEAGDLDGDRETARRRVEAAREELSRLRGIRPALEQRIAAAHADTQAEQIAKARQALERALAERAKASAAFVGAAVAKEHETLLAARVTVDQLLQVYLEVGGDDEPEADEPAWPDAAQAVAGTLAAGPVRPSAAAAASAERALRKREQAEQSRLALTVDLMLREPGAEMREMILGRLDEHLRDEAVRRFEAERARVRDQREAAAAA